MLDFLRSLTLPPAETMGALAEQLSGWLAPGFAMLGFKLKPAVQVDPRPVRRRVRRSDAVAAHASPIVVPTPDADAELPLVHMARVCEVVNASLASAERIVARHATAAVRLDAAEYALNSLLDELKGVMAPPMALAVSTARPTPKRPALPTDLPALAA